MQTTLEKLAKHDSKWRAYAYSITKNTMQGDDLVQETGTQKQTAHTFTGVF
jgi:DNA-directed RNA polymerase specialized sigma24 family protein